MTDVPLLLMYVCAITAVVLISSLIRRLTGRCSLCNEAMRRLTLTGLQSETVTTHSFVLGQLEPLVGFETSEKLDGWHVSTIITD